MNNISNEQNLKRKSKGLGGFLSLFKEHVPNDCFISFFLWGFFFQAWDSHLVFHERENLLFFLTILSHIALSFISFTQGTYSSSYYIPGTGVGNEEIDHFRKSVFLLNSWFPCLCKAESHQTLFDSLFHYSPAFFSFHYFSYASRLSFHGPVLKSCAGHDGLFCLAKFSRTLFIVCRWFMVRKLILNSASDCGWLKSRSLCCLFTRTLCQLEYFYNKRSRK